eukprot:gene16496-19587_t
MITTDSEPIEEASPHVDRTCAEPVSYHREANYNDVSRLWQEFFASAAAQAFPRKATTGREETISEADSDEWTFLGSTASRCTASVVSVPCSVVSVNLADDSTDPFEPNSSSRVEFIEHDAKSTGSGRLSPCPTSSLDKLPLAGLEFPPARATAPQPSVHVPSLATHPKDTVLNSFINDRSKRNPPHKLCAIKAALEILRVHPKCATIPELQFTENSPRRLLATHCAQQVWATLTGNEKSRTCALLATASVFFGVSFYIMMSCRFLIRQKEKESQSLLMEVMRLQ